MTPADSIWTFGPAVALATATLTATLLVLLLPWLRRHAAAQPNARSSHKVPTPQGGGIGVVCGLVVTCGITAAMVPGLQTVALIVMLATTCALAALGFADDVRPLEAAPRLALQAAAVIVAVAVLPDALRVFPVLPWWIERALLVVGGLWFVNLMNFMDGIDWMTVTQSLSLCAGLMLAGALGALPADALLVALALAGAMIGFAPFNKPVARLFLGDVGSLPLGLLFAWLLAQLAGSGHLAAAVLLPLYYLCDATITLFVRLARGERLSQAHRSHFYQRALDSGQPVLSIIGRIAIAHVLLIVLATVTIVEPSRGLNIAAVVAGAGVVTLLLLSFRKRTL